MANVKIEYLFYAIKDLSSIAGIDTDDKRRTYLRTTFTKIANDLVNKAKVKNKARKEADPQAIDIEYRGIFSGAELNVIAFIRIIDKDKLTVGASETYGKNVTCYDFNDYVTEAEIGSKLAQVTTQIESKINEVKTTQGTSNSKVTALETTLNEIKNRVIKVEKIVANTALPAGTLGIDNDSNLYVKTKDGASPAPGQAGSEVFWKRINPPTDVKPGINVNTYANKTAFPTTGEKGVFYVDQASKEIYYWDGTKYVKFEALSFNNIYDKSEVYSKTEVYPKGDVYNKTEVYSKSEVYPKGEVYNKTEVYTKGETYNKSEVYNKTEVDNTVNTLNTEITKLKAKAPIDFTIDAETTGNQVVIKFDKETNWEASQNKIITLPYETSLVFSVNKDSSLTSIPGKLRAVSGVVIVTNANMITSFSGCILKNPIDKSMLQATEVFSYFALEDGKIYLGKVW